MAEQEEIHNLCHSIYPKERLKGLRELKDSFSSLTNKEEAWEELIELTNDEHWDVKRVASEALSYVFTFVPDKQKAWEDLINLTGAENWNIRENAAKALSSAFLYVPNKREAWNNLIELTKNKDWNVRLRAADSLGFAFLHVQDKELAWNDLHKLIENEDRELRFRATTALGFAFYQLPDKEQAWNDLHRLTWDLDSYVRWRAAYSLGFAFPYAPDKQKLWNDLHGLTEDRDSDVRGSAAYSLGFAFLHIPDKQQAWEDLIRLSEDEEKHVRVYANYSLGKACIFKASHSENEYTYRVNLETAIEFFEKASLESTWRNPSIFCLPFYRSFYTIIHAQKQQAKDEIESYLAEAKNAIGGSKNKKLLFKAVEKLSNALKEVQFLENIDLEAKKVELDFYRKYCEQAAELMNDAEDTAPSATIVLRKGLPILNRKLKFLLEEIQEKAKTACQESKGTDTEEIACAVNREVQKWEIGSQEEMTWYVENLVFTLESTIPKEPENQFIFDKIRQIREEKILIKQYAILCSIIPMIPNLNVKQAVSGLAEEVHQIKEKVDTLIIALSPGIKEEFEISSGIEIFGTGAKHIVTIPLQEISYAELKDDLIRIKGKHITKLSKLPERLARKIKGYLLINDREDLVQQLS